MLRFVCLLLLLLANSSSAADTVVGWAVRKAILSNMTDADKRLTIKIPASFNGQTVNSSPIKVDFPWGTSYMTLSWSGGAAQSMLDSIKNRAWTNVYLQGWYNHQDQLNNTRIILSWPLASNYVSNGVCYTGIQLKRKVETYTTVASSPGTNNYFWRWYSINEATNAITLQGSQQMGAASTPPSISSLVTPCIYDITVQQYQTQDYDGISHFDVYLGTAGALAEQLKAEIDGGVFPTTGMTFTNPPTSTQLSQLCTPVLCSGYSDSDSGGGLPPVDPNDPYKDGSYADRCGNSSNLNLFQRSIAFLFQPCEDWQAKFSTIPDYQNKVPFGFIEFLNQISRKTGISGPLQVQFHGVQIEGHPIPDFTLDESFVVIKYWRDWGRSSVLGLIYIMGAVFMLRIWRSS